MKIYEEFDCVEINSFLAYVKDNMFDEAYNFASWLNKKGRLSDFIDGFEEVDVYSLQDYLIYYQDEIVDVYDIVDEYEKEYLN